MLFLCNFLGPLCYICVVFWGSVQFSGAALLYLCSFPGLCYICAVFWESVQFSGAALLYLQFSGAALLYLGSFLGLCYICAVFWESVQFSGALLYLQFSGAALLYLCSILGLCMATVCKICVVPIALPDQHYHCVACLGLAHAEAALDESDCGHCAGPLRYSSRIGWDRSPIKRTAWGPQTSKRSS